MLAGRVHAPSPRGALLVRFGFPPQELDTDFFTGYSDQLASAICETGRRQKQEEFLQVQSFDRVLDLQPRAGLRHVNHPATAAPGAVDSHHENIDTTLKIDAFILSHPEGHATILRRLQAMKLIKRCSALARSPQIAASRIAVVPPTPRRY